MSDHVVTIYARGDYVRAQCSCGDFFGEILEVTLSDLTEIAHEHIEAAERAEGPTMDEWLRGLPGKVAARYNKLRAESAVNWPGESAHLDSVRVEGYRPESVPFWPGQQFPLT